MTYLRHIGRRLLYPQIYIPAILFALWCAFVVLLTYFLARGTAKTNAPSCRWWCLYIPINSSVTSYVSLGVFVLLSFWMNDAYARYWRGLQVWQTELRPNIPQLAFQFAFMAKRGLWHPRDRERLLSHFAALPIVCKQHLRYSRDLSELNDILSPADIRAIAHADHMVRYMMHVFYAYWNSVDTQHKETCLSQTHPLAVFKRANQFWVLERSLLTCDEIRDVQLPVALTLHLQIFTAIWLAFLPLSIVQQNGFLSFLYLLPISYSILNLLQLGKEFADPFGTDPFDIPLHDFCEEIKVAVHEVYTDMENGRQKFIRPSDYCRASFTPHPCSKEQTGESGSSESTLSFSSVIRMFLASLPSVSATSMVVSIVWSVSGTMISWGLQFVWSEARRKQCRYWCSPVDVDKGTLRNIGFALFLILSFRAADAMGRFQDGANNLCILSQQLRSLSVEFCQNVQDGLLHACEKERFVAHVAQIPLLFRDILLGENRDFASREGLLSDEDWNTFTSSEDPLEHLLRTVEAYVMMTTMSDAAESMMKLPMTTMTYLRGLMGVRVRLIRETIWTILSVKRHPVVAAYISHQKMFTALWLFLLPLSMTSSTGFFTILWVPIISFGVLGLENIVVELVDPFGDDDVDIPVDEFCRNVSSEVVEAANSIDWNCDKLTVPTGKPESPTIGSTLCGKEVKAKYSLAYFEEHDATTENFGDESTVFFRGDDEFKEKPNLFAHFVRSVPWWVIVAVTMWAALATLISYFAREDNEGQRWWQSQFTIDSEVAKYLSFAAFMLVAFYVQEAFRRYERAGEAWNEELKARCHTMAASWVSLFGRDARHEGDHERAFSFIAAIPVILKHQLRDGRDLRELKGLLSASDILALQCSSNMVQHAIDVLRSYLLLGANFPDRLANRDDWYAGARIILMRDEIVDLERTVKDLLLLNAFPIPPAFVSLLCTLIGIWFLTLPFVLAEVSGWFTILWVPLIGYGILGMYAIAGELQDPFGTDMNDLDLDGAADAIVKDVLFVQKNYKNGNGCFIVDNPGHPSWSEGKKEGQLASDGLKGLEELSVGSSLRLALHAIPLWMLLAFSIWAAVNMTGSWLVAKYWPFLGAAAEKCKPWWCSRIAVSGSVKEYLGFALFLLLGFRLYDSHFRFVEGLRYWKELIGLTHTMTSRLFQTYPRGYWHDGDHQRIAGHITGAGIALMGALRGEGCDRDRLREVLCDGDAVRVELASDPVHYCIDVVRGYLAEGDRRQELKKLKLTRTCPESEQRVLGKCLRDMTARLRACEGIVSVPLAFGYVTHLRIVLVIWLLLLPLGVVESSGWLGIAWSVLIFYGLVGIERWSDELSDPFGLDLSDVPLEALVEELEAVVRSNLELMKHSNVPFIESGVSRTPFPEAEEQKEELVSSAAD